MAQEYTPKFRSVWNDDDWRALSAGAQHLYDLLASHPDRNSAGVLPLMPRRWCRLARGLTVDAVVSALIELDDGRFVVVDADTEEVLVRAFIRRTKVYRHIRMLAEALREVGEVESPRLRAALRAELGRLPRLAVPTLTERNQRMVDEALEAQALLDRLVADLPESAPDGMGHGLSHPMVHPMSHPMADGMTTGAQHPLADPLAHPTGAGAGTGEGAGAGAVGGETSTTVDLEGVTEADAHEHDDAEPPAVPGTRSAPLEDHAHDDAPPAPVHEGARPPARCPNHLALTDPPPCGRCRDARHAQEAWDRDNAAAIARGKAAAQEAIQAEKTAARRAIDDCGRCNERGVHLATGILCTHDPAADEAPATGRAEFRAAKAALEQRRVQRATTEQNDPELPPATGEQLTAIATALGVRGITSRPVRLQALADIVGRPVGSSKDLTRDEAHRVIDELSDRPPLVEPPPDDDIAYDPAALYTDAEQLEAAVLAARDQTDDVDDQDTWTDDQPEYVYAGGADDDPPF